MEVLLLKDFQHLFVETTTKIRCRNHSLSIVELRRKSVEVLDGKGWFLKIFAKFYQIERNATEIEKTQTKALKVEKKSSNWEN